ncbi:hypothetical protein T07_5840 [Trichinella nelsoni]|uniref:Uncharacterized protein n=1 Tax=Trichinella nelsoni TaxID=6336 RepID=A0A0V0RI50_9BILA|nr:hypothetical protein T07_5840 [Trichinella nelsoni]
MKRSHRIHGSQVKFGYWETLCLPNEDHVMKQGRIVNDKLRGPVAFNSRKPALEALCGKPYESGTVICMASMLEILPYKGELS